MVLTRYLKLVESPSGHKRTRKEGGRKRAPGLSAAVTTIAAFSPAGSPWALGSESKEQMYPKPWAYVGWLSPLTPSLLSLKGGVRYTEVFLHGFWGK